MRILITLLILLCVSTSSFGKGSSQSYVGDKKVAIVLYTRDSRGIYQKSTYVDVRAIDKSAKCYAFNKKSNLLFAYTEYGNFLFSINNDEAKVVKKMQTIKQLEGDELEAEVAAVNSALEKKFSRLNQQREKQISDSIAAVREQERKLAIERARQDSIKRVEEARRLERYRAEHDWHFLPMKVVVIYCNYCEDYHDIFEAIYMESICNDTVYYMSDVSLLGIKCPQYHCFAITDVMREHEPFVYHCQAFADSIAAGPRLTFPMISRENKEYLTRFKAALAAKASYGVFLEWDWGEEYSMLTMKYTFLNTNKKTIKYIDVYWKAINDVNDVRCTGHFKGTGPVETDRYGTWSWDDSSYFLAGDVTSVEPTKVIITYMNGTQQTLSKKMIHCLEDYE